MVIKIRFLLYICLLPTCWKTTWLPDENVSGAGGLIVVFAFKFFPTPEAARYLELSSVGQYLVSQTSICANRLSLYIRFSKVWKDFSGFWLGR